MFALLICLGAGIHPIITSSSDKKLQTAAALGKEGTVDVINYNTTPDWEKEVLRLTKGQGVDIVLETVGGSSIEKSVKSVATRGLISWIGFLGGLELHKFVDALGSLFLKVGTLKYVPALFPTIPFARVITRAATNSLSPGQFKSAQKLTKRASVGFLKKSRSH